MLLRALAAAAIVAAGMACGGRSPLAPTPAAPLQTIPTITNGRVAIVSIDGLRPDALLQTGAPNILALAARGAYTWRAQTISPSNTLPSHISMLTGYTPDVHGVTWDDYAPSRGMIMVPTVFAAARARGLRTGMVVGKEKFATFRDTGACDTWLLAALGDDDVAGHVSSATMLRPDLLFVHLPDVDLTGHASQWMSEAYLNAVRRADAAVGRIISNLPADTTIIVTADHGGRPEGHGSDSPLDTTIPWVIAGPSTARGRELSAGVSTIDTAATAAFVLGVQLQGDAQGRPVYDAFRR
jgi:arylsulfatase A-like enzyme